MGVTAFHLHGFSSDFFPNFFGSSSRVRASALCLNMDSFTRPLYPKPALRLVLLMIMQVSLAGRNRVKKHGLSPFCSDNYFWLVVGGVRKLCLSLKGLACAASAL